MSNTTLNLAFIFMAIIEIIIGVYALIGDPRSTRNRGLALLLLLFGVSNIANGALIAAPSRSSALPWMAAFVAAIYMVGPIIYLASVMILRPNWLRHRWLYFPITIFAFSPPFLVLFDWFFSGILPQPLLFAPPDAQSYFGGVLVLAELTSDAYARPLYTVGQIAMPVLALICPMLVVALKDRKNDSGNSRIAWTLATLTALTVIGQYAFGSVIEPQLNTLISNSLYLLGFVWIIFRVQDASFGLGRIQKSLDDWQVLSKMMLVVLTIVIPTVLAITLVASSLLRTSLIQEAGDNLAALALVEARNISDELQGQIGSIQRLAQDPSLVDTLRQRTEGYDIWEDDQIQELLAEQEFSWVSADPGAGTRENLLISAPETLTSMLNFLTTFPNFQLIMLIDGRGALVTATEIPTHYDYSNSGWWRQAFNNGAGGLYISPPSTRLSDQTHYVQFAVPVMDPETQDILGVVSGSYSLRPMLDKLVATEFSGNSHSDMYGPSGILVPHLEAHSSGLLENGAPFQWNRLLDSDQDWEILPFDGQSSIVSWASIGDAVGPEIEWRLAIHQPVNQALSSLASALRATIIATVVALLLAFALTLALANYITGPLSGLARVADRIREGDLFVSAPSDRKDEFGSLAATFNTMTARLRETVSVLETQVRRRTADLERQTRQLQAAAQVSQAASSILDLDSLLQTVVDVIRENFDFYYVGLFLVDVDREWAVLEAGTGEAGKAMLARGHRMRVGEGMVGWSIHNAQARIAEHAEEDIVRLQISELPDTRSEAAVPLRARGQTIGALTVQSDRPQEFGLATINILQTMADQIAIAIDNANLLAENQAALNESQKALETVRRTYQQISEEAWTTLSSQRQLDFVAADTSRRRTGSLSTGRTGTNGSKGVKEISLPLQIRDFPAGVIKLKKPGGSDDWSDEEIQMVQAYVDQLALTLESARLFQDTQLRTIQLQTSAEISQAASSILDLDRLLPEAVKLIGERFSLYYAGIFLVDEGRQWAELKAGTGEAGRIQLEENHRLEVGGNSMIGQCIAKGSAQIALDVGEQAVRFNNPHLPETRTEMAIPLNTRGETIGALTIQSVYPAAFSNEDIRVFQTMADQLANAIQNARLFALSQESAADAQKQSRISQSLVKSSILFSQSQEESQVFEIVTQEVEEQIHPDQINILTWLEDLQAFQVTERYTPGGPEDEYEVGHVISRQDRPDLWDVFNRNAKIYNPEKRPDGLLHEQYRLPLLLAGMPIGVVEIYHTASEAHIRDEDQAIIDGVILQADIALQNARAFQRMQEALSRTEALYQVGQAAISAEEVKNMLQSVVNSVTRALPADRVVLFTVDHDEEKIVNFMQNDMPADEQPQPGYKQLLEGFTGWVLREGKPILSTKGKMDRRENERIQRARQAAGFGSVIVVPLISRGRTMGVITAMNGIDQPDFTSQDTDLLMAMANQTAVAIQNAELLQETQKTAENETRLNQIGTQLIQSLDVDTILRTAVQEISRLPNVKAVSLTLGDSEADNGEGSE